MLPLEHSAILSTCIKQYIVIGLENQFSAFETESGRFTQVLQYNDYYISGSAVAQW